MTIIWCVVPEIRSTTDIIFCHSGTFFALLFPYGSRKSKFWKNEKNSSRYYHFTNVYYKWQSCCMVPELWSATDRMFLSIWTIFALLKMKKTRRYHFTIVYQKLWSYAMLFLRYGARQMEGQTDGWTDGRTDRWMNRQAEGWMEGQTDGWTDGKSDIKRWVPHLKIHLNTRSSYLYRMRG